MYTPFLRFILVVLSLGMTILFYIEGYYFNAGLSIVASILFIYGYFKYGTVYAAFQNLKRGKFNEAEKLIDKTKNPARLTRQQRGYYHFVKGMIASEKEEYETAHTELSEALKVGLRTENDISIVILNLANIEYERKKLEQAKKFLARLEGIELKPLLESEKKKLTEKINSEQDYSAKPK